MTFKAYFKRLPFILKPISSLREDTAMVSLKKLLYLLHIMSLTADHSVPLKGVLIDNSSSICEISLVTSPGISLDELCKENKLSLNDIYALTIQLFSHLNHFSEIGLVHNDIKPHNIVVVNAGTPMMTTCFIDYDEARLIGDSETCGHIESLNPPSFTKYYRAPERDFGKFSTDVRTLKSF